MAYEDDVVRVDDEVLLHTVELAIRFDFSPSQNLTRPLFDYVSSGGSNHPVMMKKCRTAVRDRLLSAQGDQRSGHHLFGTLSHWQPPFRLFKHKL